VRYATWRLVSVWVPSRVKTGRPDAAGSPSAPRRTRRNRCRWVHPNLGPSDARPEGSAVLPPSQFTTSATSLSSPGGIGGNGNGDGDTPLAPRFVAAARLGLLTAEAPTAEDGASVERAAGMSRRGSTATTSKRSTSGVARVRGQGGGRSATMGGGTSGTSGSGGGSATGPAGWRRRPPCTAAFAAAAAAPAGVFFAAATKGAAGSTWEAERMANSTGLGGRLGGGGAGCMRRWRSASTFASTSWVLSTMLTARYQS
jgi:hypothetical protein